MRHGPQALADAELLAILLGTGTPLESALSLAQRLLSEGQRQAGNGLLYLVHASVTELGRLRGVGPAKACQVKAAVELGRRLSRTAAERRSIAGPADAAQILMESLRHLEQEEFHVLMLNTKNQLLGSERISVGSLNASIVHPREVFKQAIRQSANAVILAHNHPSGDPTPSQEDAQVTARLVEAGQLLGIEVLDHLVIGDGRYTSMRQTGFGWPRVVAQ